MLPSWPVYLYLCAVICDGNFRTLTEQLTGLLSCFFYKMKGRGILGDHLLAPVLGLLPASWMIGPGPDRDGGVLRGMEEGGVFMPFIAIA